MTYIEPELRDNAVVIHQARRIDGLLRSLEQRLAHLVKHLAIAERREAGTAAVVLTCVDRPARRQVGHLPEATLCDDLMVLEREVGREPRHSAGVL